MMPTFPSPPLKFRTAGFPQYGFKASVSDRAFRPSVPVKRVPRIPRSADTFTLPFVHSHDRVKPPGPSVQVNHRPRAWTAVREVCPLYPRGPWLRPELCCLPPSSRTTTPSASLAGTRRFRRLAVYTPRLRCAGTPRRPTRPSLLSLLHCPHVPSTIRRWVQDAFPLHGLPIPGFLSFTMSRHPRLPVSASHP